ncbi:hypothetical protein AAC03nite_09000 [Alicyclobacillus acidoterrestris]|nr:hypothetical protein [Alicyclobacillus suci]GEO25115.1 hypothetical protein AAC03nite_09000 [Alicyclobacillus acidoterrestris]
MFVYRYQLPQSKRSTVANVNEVRRMKRLFEDPYPRPFPIIDEAEMKAHL